MLLFVYYVIPFHCTRRITPKRVTSLRLISET